MALKIRPQNRSDRPNFGIFFNFHQIWRLKRDVVLCRLGCFHRRRCSGPGNAPLESSKPHSNVLPGNERVRDGGACHVRLTRDVGDPCRVVREAHNLERFGFPVARWAKSVETDSESFELAFETLQNEIVHHVAENAARRAPFSETSGWLAELSPDGLLTSEMMR